MITGRCEGKSQEGLAGSCSHPSAAPTLCAPFPAHVLIFSTAALQQMRAEQKRGVALLAAGQYCCSPALNQKPAVLGSVLLQQPSLSWGLTAVCVCSTVTSAAAEAQPVPAISSTAQCGSELVK